MLVAGTGPMPMIRGSTPAAAIATTRAIGVEPVRLDRRLGRDEQRGRAVVDAGGVAGGDRSAVAERRPCSAASASAVVPARVLVGVDDTGSPFALRHRDGDDLLGEPAVLLGAGGPLLAAQGEGVLVGAAMPCSSATFSAVSRIESVP